MLTATCLKGKCEAKLEFQGGRDTNQITILRGSMYIFFGTTHFCHTNHLLLEEPLMLFTSLHSLGVDSFSILLIMALGRKNSD